MSQLLNGLRVLEMGTLIAGPFAGRLFADFGADVIKVETPKQGDPIRKWRLLKDDVSLWWHVQGRNKKSITVDLKREKGQEIIKELVKETDIVIENFRPGKLEEWGLGYEDLKRINPRIIMVRISGYGQDGPYHKRPGFGSIGEAMGGIRYLTGYPDRPPTRVGISLGDSVSSLYAVMGAMMAVYHRDVLKTNKGQYIDIALYESIFSLMESMVPEYDVYQFIRERTGSTLPGIVPSNTYICKDGKYIVIGGNGDSIFKRLMTAIGREDVANDAAFQTNDCRVQQSEFLDAIINEWAGSLPLEEALSILEKHDVPAGSIYSIEDIMNDPHYQAREMILDTKLKNGEHLKMPGIMPKFSETPGEVKWTGPSLGEHNDEVLKNILHLTEEEVIALKLDKII
ncbi:CaiB/BaiF CoA-transferase family protein [Neobacillus mesonae]|uniref:CaiB/BaiF CoA transferase family protein n=1 Tax=Neobacillus mesonae TaxID=1193713 RepID=UPI00203FB354|nr:CoA transferase [Neobacillus mesonae]MCM3568482.1 CoA transferase [Neobacillus mesonae]